MKKVVAKRDAGALSPAALIHFFTERDDHSPGAVESWDMLLANVESQETLGVFMALADFTRAITEADPRTLAYLSQLSVVHYLLGLLEVPIFHPFTETIIRAIEDAMIIPGLNFEGLCGRSLLATLFTTLPPRCRDAAVVLRMARPLVVAWPPLGVEFLADGHAAILFETYAGRDLAPAAHAYHGAAHRIPLALHRYCGIRPWRNGDFSRDESVLRRSLSCAAAVQPKAE
jgi:hypothetical protein